MSSAKLTLIGLENYLNSYEDSLFTDLRLPSEINRDDFINNTLMEGGEFEVIFSDPELLKPMIALWGRKWNQTFDKWIRALNASYDPLENYDRTEVGTDTHTGTVVDAGTGSQTGTVNTSNDTSHSGTVTIDNDTTNTGTVSNAGTQTGTVDVDATVTNEVSAYNVSTYSPENKETTDNTRTDNLSTSDTRTDNLAGTSDTTTTYGDRIDTNNLRTDNLFSTNNNTKTNDLTDRHDLRIHGNIGVTTSQQMLQSELDLRYWNLLNKMSSLFLAEFVIPIY